MLLAAAWLGGCSSISDQPLGPLREVTVISREWDAVAGTVSSILQQPVATPQPEPEFRLRVGTLDRFDTYSRFRLLLVIGTTADSLVLALLGTRADSLAAADYGLFRITNPWVKNQFVLLFVARTPELLVPGLELYAARIRHSLREILMLQMQRAVYREGLDRELTDSIGRRCRFTIDVPKRWRLNDDSLARGFFYIFGHYPDRSVFVSWQDTVRPLELAAVVRLRDSVTGRFYDGDSVEPGYVQAESILFLARPVLRVTGVWQNNRRVLGGPFVAYAFNYQERFFLLDGSVFNPGQRKLNALAQVEAIIRTFTPD